MRTRSTEETSFVTKYFFILRLLHEEKWNIMNYAKICVLPTSICENLYIKWPLCPRNVVSYSAQSSILLCRSMSNERNHLLDLEGDSACNLVNLFLGTFTRIRVKKNNKRKESYSISDVSPVRIKASLRQYYREAQWTMIFVQLKRNYSRIRFSVLQLRNVISFQYKMRFNFASCHVHFFLVSRHKKRFTSSLRPAADPTSIILRTALKKHNLR